MTGVLEGVRVLDLAWGISGPMAAMILADNGAEVTRIEPPGGDPFRSMSGHRVWNRGKRSAVLDLHVADDLECFLALAAEADVLIEGFTPGTTERLGIDYETLATANPRLVYCSITGYGPGGGPGSDRPAYDALVAARTGHQWESRGYVPGTTSRLNHLPDRAAGVEVPPDRYDGAPRTGPLFSGVPWPSIGAAHLATLGISAALLARETTGRGQHVATSLAQGVLLTTTGAWQRVQHAERAGFITSITDPRSPKGYFRCADGRWIHNWTPNPGFLLAVSKGDRLEIPPEGIQRWGVPLTPEGIPLLHQKLDECAAAVARFTSDEWMAIALEADVSVQRVRSPEEALLDDLMVDDGCVIEVEDPQLGPVRQVGPVFRLSACPARIRGAAPELGQHTEEVRAEASGRGGSSDPPAAPTGAVGAPLDGVKVIDLGLAVAGPFGSQTLADLGAEVIRVSMVTEQALSVNPIAMLCNRGKRSIAVDLKNPEGLEILHKLFEWADVVHSNMRAQALERLGVTYEALKERNPSIIYCHTRGHDRARQNVIGHDQSSAALGGVTWMEGGLDDGGRPLWPVTSIGDIGNGLLSAMGVIQALYHRARTGEGQFVDSAIVYSHLLNTSTAWITPDGKHVAPRQQLDAQQLGWNALYRLYHCAEDTWLCIAAIADEHWRSLCRALGRAELAGDVRFATAAERAANDEALIGELEPMFTEKPAAEWFGVLDGAGVPCEVSAPDFIMGAIDDPEWRRRGWIADYVHPIVGRMEVFGKLIDFSETPMRIERPPYCPGQHTHEILEELGYDEERIAKLEAQGVVNDTSDDVAAALAQV